MSPNQVVGHCRLCLDQDVELRDSHILPKWAYRRIRKASEGKANPNPVHFRDGVAFQTSKQLSEHLLCPRCEQAFGRRENYISRIVYQLDGSAPILDLLAFAPVQDDPTWRTATPGGLDSGQLVYFAASVFWRAHVSSDLDGYTLGPRHAENFRRFLLGEAAFPNRANIALLVDEDAPGAGCEVAHLFMAPRMRRFHGHYLHSFPLFGIRPMLAVGALIPSWMTEICLVRGRDPRVFVQPPTAGSFGYAMARMVATSRPSRAMRRARE